MMVFSWHLRVKVSYLIQLIFNALLSILYSIILHTAQHRGGNSNWRKERGLADRDRSWGFWTISKSVCLCVCVFWVPNLEHSMENNFQFFWLKLFHSFAWNDVLSTRRGPVVFHLWIPWSKKEGYSILRAAFSSLADVSVVLFTKKNTHCSAESFKNNTQVLH